MSLRISLAAVTGSAILLGGLFWQGSVPSASLKTPMDFGAVGDGTTDDTDAMQRAIDATQNGGSLYFPGGHKYLVRSLHATGEVHWLGPGGSWLNDRAADGAVIIQGNDAKEDLLTLTNAAYSNISGLAFDGNKLNQKRPLNGIRMVNCEFTRCDNIYVTSCSGSGILLENVNTVQTSDEIDFVDCYSVLNGQDGVRFDFTGPGGVFAPGDCEIIGGHYDFNTGAGIALHVSSYTSINGANILSNHAAGISAQYCTGLNIANNMVRNNGRQGIVLGSGPAFTNCNNCSIAGNQVHLNSRSGVGQFSNIDVGYGTAHTRLIGNYCGDVNASASDPVSSAYGIWLHDGVTGNLVVGNTCPKEDHVKGGIFAEPGTTFTASSNLGIADSASSDSETLPTTGREIGFIVAAPGSTTWIGLTGTMGGTVRLPKPSGLLAGQTILFKDEGGNAGHAPITISGSGAQIDGASSARLNANFGSLRIRYDGSAWWRW
ncbi:MAG: glycosyl hydrolase family 28-related protein [Fimbriimonas sp.]|nr:glycosyl hydrolase family 28-related protein [Fimbriimonas sp.]